MFSVHSLFLLLMKVRIFRSPRCYSLPPWSPPLYCRWNGQFGSRYRDHHEDDDHSFHCWIWSCAFNLFALAMSRSECNIKQFINLGWNKFSKTYEDFCRGRNSLRRKVPISCLSVKRSFFHDSTNPLFCVGWHWVVLVLLADVITMPLMSKARASKQCCELVTPHHHCYGLHWFNHNSKCCFMTFIWKG